MRTFKKWLKDLSINFFEILLKFAQKLKLYCVCDWLKITAEIGRSGEYAIFCVQ